jgi:hypothetical protein
MVQPLSPFLVGCLLTGALLACAPPNITVHSNERIDRRDEVATLVVIQPRTRGLLLSLLDGQGALVGQVHDNSHTVVRVPVGPFRLYLIPMRNPEMGDRVEGEMYAGKIYFATVSLRFRGFKINSLNPDTRDGRWEYRERWLEETPRVQMDPARVDELAQALGDPEPLLQTVDAYVDRMDETHREARRVRAADGL